MPVEGIQKRMPEIGRLRLGDEKTDPNRPGRPLDTFRFTSADEHICKAFADVFGGNVTSWAQRSEQLFAVIAERKRIPIVVPPSEFTPYTQWYEWWDMYKRNPDDPNEEPEKGSFGCQRRCTGPKSTIDRPANVIVKTPDGFQMQESPCLCLREEPAAREKAAREGKKYKRRCGLRTRLNIIVREMEIIGISRMETGSENAAEQIPAVVDGTLAMNGGQPFWASLRIVDSKVDSLTLKSQENPGGRLKFKYPVIDVERSVEALVEAATQPAQLGDGGVRRLPGVGPVDTRTGEINPPALPDRAPQETTGPAPDAAEQESMEQHVEDGIRERAAEQGDPIDVNENPPGDEPESEDKGDARGDQYQEWVAEIGRFTTIQQCTDAIQDVGAYRTSDPDLHKALMKELSDRATAIGGQK